MANIWNGLATPADSPQSTTQPSSWDGFATPANPVISAPEQSFAEKALYFVPHQAGILSKNVVKGATFLPNLIANIPAATANAVRGAGDWAFDVPQSSPSVGYVSPYSEGADTVFGKNAQPNNAAERIEGDTISALSGVGTSVKLGQEALKTGSNFIAPGLANFLAYKPAIQAQSAAGGAASGSGAKELGFGPKMQTAISLMGGLAAPAAAASLNGAWGAIQPFTESGKKTIVNNTIAKYATDPQAAIAALQSSPDYVPGFIPTGGTSSGDTGLIGLERTLQQQPESDFANRYVQNNAAVNNYFGKLAGTPADIAAAQAERTSATNPLYEQAKNGTIKLDAIKPALDNIDKQIAEVGENSDAGKTLLSLKAKIQGTLPQENNVNTGLLDASGNPITKTVADNPPFSNAVQIYREERDNLAKRGDQQGAYGSTVRNIIEPANKQYGQTLEAQNPYFQKAQSLYQQKSVPINQMQNMQEIGKKVTGGTTDATGNYFFSPAKTGNLIKEGQINTDYNGWQPLNKALSPSQYEGINNINSELQRANLVNTAAATRVGSNTFNNLASTNALSNLTGGRVAGHIPFVNGFYNQANDQIRQKLIQAILTKEATANALKTGVANNPSDTLVRALLKNGGLAAYMSQSGNAINGYNQ